MVRTLFFLLIVFRVTICPVICAAGGELGFCCQGCASEAQEAAPSECPCCSDQECRSSEETRSAEGLFASDCAPIAPAGEDGLCNGDCACKVLPEKGKTQFDSRTCLGLEAWNGAEVGAVAIKSYSPSPSQLHAASPPAGKTVRIARCSLLI